MMQCPSCSAALASGEARCGACQALVNPPVQGASALAPRLVTPRSIEGAAGPLDPPSLAGGREGRPHSGSRNPADEAWRREVLERVRKRRQVRARSLPLFVESPPGADVATPEPVAPPVHERPAVPRQGLAQDDIPDRAPAPEASARRAFEDFSQREITRGKIAGGEAPDLLAAFDVPLSDPPEDPILDLPLRPAEAAAAPQSGPEAGQSLVDRPRPTPVGTPGSRSLVAGLPLVEPSRPDPAHQEPPPRKPALTVSSRAASISDRTQAAFIDLGIWSGMTVTAFYFASRIAHTSIVGLGPAWQGLTLFGFVLASAYMLFFGGLSGATPGKIACGIQVRRYDGSSLGPLASLGRGLLGVLGVLLLGIGIWPAFWDKDRRALHDRATDSRVTTV